MVNERDLTGDLAVLAVPLVGRLVETGDPWRPYRLIGAAGVAVEPVSEFFRELQAKGRSVATTRSYGMDLLRWFRFLWASEVPWDRATRIEARDFSRLAPGHRAVTSTSLAAGRVFAGAGSARCRCGLRGFGARA